MGESEEAERERGQKRVVRKKATKREEGRMEKGRGERGKEKSGMGGPSGKVSRLATEESGANQGNKATNTQWPRHKAQTHLGHDEHT